MSSVTVDQLKLYLYFNYMCATPTVGRDDSLEYVYNVVAEYVSYFHHKEKLNLHKSPRLSYQVDQVELLKCHYPLFD